MNTEPTYDPLVNVILDTPLEDSSEPDTLRHIVETFYIEPHAAKAAVDIGFKIASVVFQHSVEQLIQDCIAAKEGNKEFALFSLGNGKWRAEIGNECAHVILGEIDGEFRGEGKTIRDAVTVLLENVRAGKRASLMDEER